MKPGRETEINHGAIEKPEPVVPAPQALDWEGLTAAGRNVSGSGVLGHGEFHVGRLGCLTLLPTGKTVH